MKNFVSVSTNAARIQDISLNPQKLAGMCAKLKCCMNYEVDNYMEAGKRLPSREVILQTQDNDYYLFKTDILAGMITYSTDKRLAANLETISASRAKEIIEMNRRGEKPLTLQEEGKQAQANENGTVDLLQGDISRFDKTKKKKKKKNNHNNAHNEQPREAVQQNAAQQNSVHPNSAQQNSAQSNSESEGNGQRHHGHQHHRNRNNRRNNRHNPNGQQQDA